MELKLLRKFKLSKYTLGRLSVNGVYFCDTIEDVDRGLTSSMDLKTIQSKKVYGQTAIPTGTYKIQMGVVSPKFKDRSWAVKWGGKLPRLVDVKGFDGVLVHVGTTQEDTLGCIIVGQNKAVGKVLNSSVTLDKLMPLLIEANYRGEDITLTIE